jgi:uncharacterized protein
MTATIAGDPQAELVRLFDSAAGPRLLIIPHSRIFAIDCTFAEALRRGDPQAAREAAALAASVDGELSLDLVPSSSPQSISLNVSATCNLACGYCYAARGAFAGAQPSAMSWEVARAAVDRLLESSNPQVPITVGFIGGEPFLNRKLIRKVVEHCWDEARRRGRVVRFAVTTNATVLSADDLDLLRAYPFGVTVSIDGGAATQDVQRPSPAGRSSFAALRDAVLPLLHAPGLAKVGARATVIRTKLEVGTRFDEIIGLGFREAGFSPVRNGPSDHALDGENWRDYLDSMIDLARREMSAAFSGGPIRLSNLAIALKQLHRGFSMPYPCGAGGGYFSVAADGTWYACHRAIGQPSYALGDNEGLDEGRRTSFLHARHVHAQLECRRCWARYLCSGGCHQEASARSDSSCGFIRGWLDFCLGAYSELMERRPDWFKTQTAAGRPLT